MAHIATCMATEPATITKPGSPSRNMFSSSSPPKHSAKSFASLKAAQAEQTQRYQLFPKDKPLPTPTALNTGKALPVPVPVPVAVSVPIPASQASESNGKASSPLAGIRIRLNQNNLVRRRKVSVPELGPMTTVQEVSMDSPTIPGHPPIHERSASAPEEGSSRLAGPMEETVKASSGSSSGSLGADNLAKAIEDAFEIRMPATKLRSSPSPRKLAPLVIPPTDSLAPLLKSKHSSSQLRSASTPSSDQPRSGRLDAGAAALGRLTPASTPDLSLPRSATTTEATSSTTPTIPTPVSAPLMDHQRSSPHAATSDDARNPFGHRRAGSEPSNTMDRDRGRPSKRKDKTDKTKSSERRAFEELPTGWRPSEAMSKLKANDVVALHKQALGQAERFEVLKVEAVEALSKELRQLDERTDYLRRTYSSLRAGRRNLHSRICQYLRSPRVAKFSHESMLRQEEALAELDASIDDWVTKLEQAENRRTRVRQKLLEHVAAAAILLPAGPPPAAAAAAAAAQAVSTPPRSPEKQQQQQQQQAAVSEPSSSCSPQRVVAQVPSSTTAPEQRQAPAPPPAVKKTTSRGAATTTTTTTTTAAGRSAVESIRVYAGDDLYALLADVEDEIARLGAGAEELVAAVAASPPPPLRNRSQEKLLGDKSGSPRSTAPSPPPTVEAPSPPSRAVKKESVKEAQAQMLLTNAVFKP